MVWLGYYYFCYEVMGRLRLCVMFSCIRIDYDYGLCIRLLVY
jgi:hypothetical protein